jgi:hypothetical protein
VPSGPFSHKLHLKLKPDCNTCHTGAANSTGVQDNLLPSKESCKPCHQDANISAPPKVLISKFSHQQHLKLGNVAPAVKAAVGSGTYLGKPNYVEQLDTKNACLACHRGVEASEAPSHDLLPQMADCLVCHNKIDVPYSCVTCHDKGQNLKPADHTNDFVDRHTTAKVAKVGCAVCHGRRFTCMGCHAA